MNYTVKINGKSYTMPPRTIAVDERIEEIEALSKRYLLGELTRREMLQIQYDFVQYVAPDALGDFEQVDTNDLLKTTLDILYEYNAPAIDAQSKAAIGSVKKLVNSPEVANVLTLAKMQK